MSGLRLATYELLLVTFVLLAGSIQATATEPGVSSPGRSAEQQAQANHRRHCNQLPSCFGHCSAAEFCAWYRGCNSRSSFVIGSCGRMP